MSYNRVSYIAYYVVVKQYGFQQCSAAIQICRTLLQTDCTKFSRNLVLQNTTVSQSYAGKESASSCSLLTGSFETCYGPRHLQAVNKCVHSAVQVTGGLCLSWLTGL